MPEIWIALFGFLANHLWESVQCPWLYGMAGLRYADGVRMDLRSSAGDVVILLVAFAVVAIRRGRGWVAAPSRADRIVFVGIGLAITIVYELLATRLWERWTYADSMPVVLGVGLAPIAQWLVLPPIILALAGRGLRGAPTKAAA